MTDSAGLIECSNAQLKEYKYRRTDIFGALHFSLPLTLSHLSLFTISTWANPVLPEITHIAFYYDYREPSLGLHSQTPGGPVSRYIPSWHLFSIIRLFASENQF